MSRLSIVVGAVGCCFLAANAHAVGWDGHAVGWDLVTDVRASGNQISFAQGTRNVWYFMESHSLKEAPTTYRQLPHYYAPCINGPEAPLTDGTGCWQSGYTPDNNPRVGINFTDQSLVIFGLPVAGRTLWLHPAPDKYSIVAWRSPIEGTITVHGTATSLNDQCGNGTRWMVDLNALRLLSGGLPRGATRTFQKSGIKVSPGGVLYFIVDPVDQDYGCDWVGLDLKIRATLAPTTP